MTMQTESDIVPSVIRIVENNGFSLNRYKKTFIQRRIVLRMNACKISDVSEYLRLLKTPDEFEAFVKSISVNVTSFFRDVSPFDTIGRKIIPLLASRPNLSGVLRVWSAGCATGEEPYSVSILLNERLRRTSLNYEIFATDRNQKALDHASDGIYKESDISKIDSLFKARYFTKFNVDSYQVSPQIRKPITFRLEDISKPTTKKFDMIFCRNVMIYFEKQAQDVVVNNFYNSLKPGGFLVSGMDEVFVNENFSNLFTPFDLKQKIFQKREKPLN
ncbi:MAG: Chemotaxis protein methyltransferase [Nitrosopumilus sp.]|nr:Chemotaxis protein methyltransferase [Nitrosopumilus sp.]